MKDKYKRLIKTAGLIALGSLAFYFVLEGFKTSLIYYVKPEELSTKHYGKTVRVGGIVKINSFDKSQKTFILGESLKVFYKTPPPPLFRENQEAVVEGIYTKDGFYASRIFAKHDENYFPKEVVEKLKKAGQWRGK